jgi:hypothetical protein
MSRSTKACTPRSVRFWKLSAFEEGVCREDRLGSAQGTCLLSSAPPPSPSRGEGECARWLTASVVTAGGVSKSAKAAALELEGLRVVRRNAASVMLRAECFQTRGRRIVTPFPPPLRGRVRVGGRNASVSGAVRSAAEHKVQKHA